MAQVYNRLIVDVRREVRDIITAVQNDSNSRFLDVHLKDGALAIDLTGHEVRIYGKKFDKTEFFNNGEITDAENGRCQFELTDKALAVAHDIEVQIAIFKDNKQVLQSLPFRIKVVKSLISAGAVESSNEYGALVVLFQNLYEAYDLMTTMVKNIGMPSSVADNMNIDTMWEAWEFMCKYLKDDVTKLLQDAMNNNSVDGVVKRIGESSDTGDNTVFGKLNKTGIKSSQRGIAKGSAVSTSGDYEKIKITINNINPQNAFVILQDTTDSGRASGGNYYSSLVELTQNELTITSHRNTYGSDVRNYPTSWQVVEFY